MCWEGGKRELAWGSSSEKQFPKGRELVILPAQPLPALPAEGERARRCARSASRAERLSQRLEKLPHTQVTRQHSEQLDPAGSSCLSGTLPHPAFSGLSAGGSAGCSRGRCCPFTLVFLLPLSHVGAAEGWLSSSKPAAPAGCLCPTPANRPLDFPGAHRAGERASFFFFGGGDCAVSACGRFWRITRHPTSGSEE